MTFKKASSDDGDSCDDEKKPPRKRDKLPSANSRARLAEADRIQFSVFWVKT
jgi:hypothetical protein